MHAIEDSPFPLAFRVADGGRLMPGAAPAAPGEIAVRVAAGALAGMQKQALVRCGGGAVWQMACDEGPYLNGSDLAPFPLAFFTAGLVLSVFERLAPEARRRGLDYGDTALVLDCFYTMAGSALAGTMVGGALAPHFELRCESTADGAALAGMLCDIVASTPALALLRKPLDSLFTVTRNGERVAPGRVAALDAPVLPDPEAALDAARPERAGRYAPGIIEKLESAESVFGVEGGAGSSLEATQKRSLHVRGVARRRGDGLAAVRTRLFRPIGSIFQFLGDPAGDRAPPPLAFLSAGIAFCYLTQLGRFAHIAKQRLERYALVQDTCFGGEAGARPVESHVHIVSDESVDDIRRLVDMGEQTCFLHGACRTALKPRLRIARHTKAER